jgi:co-chaperonin GroES (HSP10)
MAVNSWEKKSIFDANSQLLGGTNPADWHPIYDRVVIKALPEDVAEGSILIPDQARDRSKLRRGLVVAVGPGDPYIQYGTPNNDGTSKLKAVKCSLCHRAKRLFSTGIPKAGVDNCFACKGTGLGTLPMTVKPGDVVLFDRRREAEFNVDGETYCLVNESQSVFCILEA